MPRFKVVKSETREEFDREVKKHRLRLFSRGFLIFAVLLLLIAGAFIYWENLVYTSFNVISKSVRYDAENARYLALNGHVLKLSKDGAEAFDGTNRALWNMTYEMQDPISDSQGDYVAVGDRGSTEILVMDPEGNQTAIMTRLPVEDFCIAGQGVVAAVLEDTDSMRIILYDKNGNELAAMKCSMGQSGYPIGVTLSPSGTLLGVSYVRVEGDTLRSSVAFYNFGDVGQNEIDNLVSGYDFPDSVFPKLEFLNNSLAAAIGDNRLVYFSGDQKPEILSENAINEEIQSAFVGDDKIALVFISDSAPGEYRLDIYDSRGKLALSRDFSLDYTDIQLGRGAVAIYNESECLIMDYKGREKYQGLFEDPVVLMMPTESSRRFILVNRQTVQTIQLTNW